MKAVAVIPARGGSKRIPRKNIKSFHGRPMIAWSIAAARASDLFDRIIVSTDDAEIAEIARAAGAEAPFLRDAALADDQIGVTEVVQDAIARLGAEGAVPDLTCLIYATAPFLRATDLRAGHARLIETGSLFAVSVTSFPAPIQRALVIEQGHVRMMNEENLLVRSQDLVEAYHDAGQFCWGLTEGWRAGPRVFRAPTAPVMLPRYRVQDIDTPEDWERAEIVARVLEEEAGR
ncbi:putative acylneuraminate cytidylyltransferase [Octadecabacter antarcticus 307]|uniref:Putative acylneuraminate cytidylyltransferase n=1 Tax=Octadecabacter antarcticus 307 TaxID=391626 RepID=M9RA70_9RHOB|nr:pseudaminic acid cytidylyltransferase [Octadecabacter antarcticus]AGI66650.1 putative acylneuraminate cytidylyltransferase [Octadecabacter antarcticus 307]